MLAYCGLRCDTCPIFLATIEPDPVRKHQMRVEIAEECTNIYDEKTLPEDITDCDGCRAATGRIYAGCAKCRIRSCASLKDINNCAFCDDYGCKALNLHFMLDPESKKNLEKIRRGS